jgi:hypothetical protein
VRHLNVIDHVEGHATGAEENKRRTARPLLWKRAIGVQ